MIRLDTYKGNSQVNSLYIVYPGKFGKLRQKVGDIGYKSSVRAESQAVTRSN